MIANALPRPLTAGSVDNAILRADGTDGTILQTSGLIVEDAIIAFTPVTGDATTDVITVTGSSFANGQPVRFTGLTGGSGLSTGTNYFVREASGATFKVEATIGGGAVNFTTNITAGTILNGHSVSPNVTLSQNTAATNSALILLPKGTGALIASRGGNARGNNALDLQITRSSATQIASGANSVLMGGVNNTASGQNGGVVCGEGNTASGINGPFIGGGLGNTASSGRGVICGGQWNTASGTNYDAVVNGFQNTASGGATCIGSGSSNLASGVSAFIGSGSNNTASGGSAGILCGIQALADRLAMQAHAAGQFSAIGDAQRARFVMRNKTTTNSAVELFLDGSATRLTIPSGKVLGLTINITGISSTGAAVAHYLRQYALKNVSGTTSEVYAPITIGTDNAAGTSIALSASDASDALIVSVTGTASTIWRWVASVDAVEIAFGT
jgi:hypothetical protein